MPEQPRILNQGGFLFEVGRSSEDEHAWKQIDEPPAHGETVGARLPAVRKYDLPV